MEHWPILFWEFAHAIDEDNEAEILRYLNRLILWELRNEKTRNEQRAQPKGIQKKHRRSLN